MKDRSFIILTVSLIVAGAIIYWLAFRPADSAEPQQLSDTVSQVDGQQIITILAKGGYSPRKIKAAANLPTILRVKTNATFDCSSSLVIPSLNYRKYLAPTGQEDIVIKAEQATGKMTGLCGMGMYSFEIDFS